MKTKMRKEEKVPFSPNKNVKITSLCQEPPKEVVYSSNSQLKTNTSDIPLAKTCEHIPIVGREEIEEMEEDSTEIGRQRSEKTAHGAGLICS